MNGGVGKLQRETAGEKRAEERGRGKSGELRVEDVVKGGKTIPARYTLSNQAIPGESPTTEGVYDLNTTSLERIR